VSSSLPQTVRIRGGGESLRSAPERSEFLKIMMMGIEDGYQRTETLGESFMIG
jgi:hypothetical protein